MAKNNYSISAFFPAYNDAGTISSMVITVLLTLRELTDDYEVIVVNDGSQDHTPAVLDELGRVYPNEVRIIHHPQNRGYGGALRTGFYSATKDWVFYTDGDAQYDPRELANLAALVSDDVDFINGWKIERNDPLHRILIGRIYQYIIKATFDALCGWQTWRVPFVEEFLSLALASSAVRMCGFATLLLRSTNSRWR